MKRDDLEHIIRASGEIVSLAREYGQENARGRVLPACQLIKIRTALREPGFREGRGSSNDALTQRQPERIELRR